MGLRGWLAIRNKKKKVFYAFSRIFDILNRSSKCIKWHVYDQDY